MQRIIVIPNLHLPNSQFAEWAKSIAKPNVEVIEFGKTPQDLINMEWKGILNELKLLNETHNQRGFELYYLTEGWGFLPVLEAVESNQISGIFSIQPIIIKEKKIREHSLYSNSLDIKHLLEQSSSAMHLFFPEKGFENDYKRSIKHLKNIGKPNICVKSYNEASLLSEHVLDEIRSYILYNLGH